MNVPDPRQSLARFRAAISQRAGLYFADDKRPLLSSALATRAHENGLSIDAYCALIEQGQSKEIGALAEILTVGETYFFRNTDHFRALRELVLPQLIARLPPGRKLRVLSAGCATGEEPYSIAMLLAQLGHRDAEITAFDLNPAVIEHAQRAQYSAWALRETDASIRARWFSGDGKSFVLAREIRDAVTFLKGNLTDNAPHLFRAEHYDLILCRNVLMYFTPEAMAQVVTRLGQCLSPDGYLFLGHAETLRGTGSALNLCNTHATFYYQRTSRSTDAANRPQVQQPSPLSQHASPAQPSVDAALPWYEAIAAASDRVRHLTSSPATPAASFAPRIAAADGILELLRQERRKEVLSLLRQTPETQRDSASKAMEAALLVQDGKLREAQTICHTLITRDERDAHAHYVLALAQEQEGDADAASQHSQAACELDPRFAMPQLHLGLLHRRAGRHAHARAALLEAQRLLPTEQAMRVALFGGGFTREALLQMCAAELTQMERSP